MQNRMTTPRTTLTHKDDLNIEFEANPFGGPLPKPRYDTGTSFQMRTTDRARG